MSRISRSSLIKDFGLCNLRVGVYNRNFHLSAEVRALFHCDHLYAAEAVKNPDALQSVVLTWRNETISSPPGDFRLWMYPDFSTSSEYREILTREELEARIQHAKDNGAEYLFNQETGPICPGSDFHVFHEVKRDLASRITMLYEQEMFTMCNLSNNQDPNG